jgi:hypothetical protein
VVDDMFVIKPESATWDFNWDGYEPLPDEFEFGSDTNDWWLTPEELLGLAAAA